MDRVQIAAVAAAVVVVDRQPVVEGLAVPVGDRHLIDRPGLASLQAMRQTSTRARAECTRSGRAADRLSRAS